MSGTTPGNTIYALSRDKLLMHKTSEMTNILSAFYLTSNNFSRQMARVSAPRAAMQTLYQTKGQTLVHNIFKIRDDLINVSTLPGNKISLPLFH